MLTTVVADATDVVWAEVVAGLIVVPDPVETIVVTDPSGKVLTSVVVKGGVTVYSEVALLVVEEEEEGAWLPFVATTKHISQHDNRNCTSKSRTNNDINYQSRTGKWDAAS